MKFSDLAEMEHALEAGIVSLHSKIKAMYDGIDAAGKPRRYIIDTTQGRFLVANLLPRKLGIGPELVNAVLTKKAIGKIIDEVYRLCGQKATVIFCDKVM